MSPKSSEKTILGDTEFQLWIPEEGRAVMAGAEKSPIPLPRVPLPVHRADLADGEPSDDAIGLGIFDYLRQFPDCPYNVEYAEILREAYSHYIYDLAAQVVMLDHKEVDAPYIRRMINGLKIMALLEPENPGLLQRIGMACYELGTMFAELGNCGSHMVEALGFLQRSLKCHAENPTALNYLGQIEFLLGDYDAAARRWRGVLEMVEDEGTKEAFAAKIARIDAGEVPSHPQVDDLESVGEAMALYGSGDHRGAMEILERLEEGETIASEFPFAEFHYLLGMCREKCGEAGGAFAAFDRALEMNPDFVPAQEGKDRVAGGGL